MYQVQMKTDVRSLTRRWKAWRRMIIMLRFRNMSRCQGRQEDGCLFHSNLNKGGGFGFWPIDLKIAVIDLNVFLLQQLALSSSITLHEYHDEETRFM